MKCKHHYEPRWYTRGGRTTTYQCVECGKTICVGLEERPDSWAQEERQAQGETRKKLLP